MRCTGTARGTDAGSAIHRQQPRTEAGTLASIANAITIQVGLTCIGMIGTVVIHIGNTIVVIVGVTDCADAITVCIRTNLIGLSIAIIVDAITDLHRY